MDAPNEATNVPDDNGRAEGIGIIAIPTITDASDLRKLILESRQQTREPSVADSK